MGRAAGTGGSRLPTVERVQRPADVLFERNLRRCLPHRLYRPARVPGRGAVLRARAPEAHPGAVQRFFRSVPPEPESEPRNRALGPREWLLTGHPVAAVVALASDI